MNFIHLMRNASRSLLICLICVLPLFMCSPLFSQTIRVDTTHPVKSIIPTEALGAGIDRLPTAATDKLFTEATMKQVLSAGWQTVTYRQNTELFVEAWHWNPQGTWSDSSGKGYFVGNPKPGDFVRHSFGSLPATTFPCSLFASLSGSIAGLFSQQTATRSPIPRWPKQAPRQSSSPAAPYAHAPECVATGVAQQQPTR